MFVFLLDGKVCFIGQVLKKEIDVVQLKWYAYCLLKALANLHKQVYMISFV